MKSAYTILIIGACVLIGFGMVCRFQETVSKPFWTGILDHMSFPVGLSILTSVAISLSAIGYAIASLICKFNP